MVHGLTVLRVELNTAGVLVTGLPLGHHLLAPDLVPRTLSDASKPGGDDLRRRSKLFEVVVTSDGTLHRHWWINTLTSNMYLQYYFALYHIRSSPFKQEAFVTVTLPAEE